MRHVLCAFGAVLFVSACGGGDSYDGPGKELVGGWRVDSYDYQATVDGQPYGSSGSGGGRLEIYPEDEHLMMDDGECAFPALGEGDDRMSMMQSESCVRDIGIGELYTHVVANGSASLSGEHLTVQISGTLRPLSGPAQGSFMLVYLGQPDESQECVPGTDCEGGGDDNGGGDEGGSDPPGGGS